MNTSGSRDYPVMNTLGSPNSLSIWYQHYNWLTKNYLVLNTAKSQDSPVYSSQRNLNSLVYLMFFCYPISVDPWYIHCSGVETPLWWIHWRVMTSLFWIHDRESQLIAAENTVESVTKTNNFTGIQQKLRILYRMTMGPGEIVWKK